MKNYKNLFQQIISLDNLFSSWEEFRKGKQTKPDVMKFEFNLEENIFKLHNELKNKIYRHGPYASFYINDPKPRHIHKAPVKDRIAHHAVFRVLNLLFEPTFIYDSYSCRHRKGTHKGINRLAKILRKITKNNRSSCFILKCDIKKFFKSMNRKILLSIIQRRIKDNDALWLIKEIVQSFPYGIPLGNLTSQLFANIYLNELDQFVKHQLKIPFYIRYTDDFVIIDISRQKLENWFRQIQKFLYDRLNLEIHPNKTFFRKYHQGIDFLGYNQFPYYRLLRNKTKKRILKKVNQGISEQSFHSYLGVLSHADTPKLTEKIKNLFWLHHEK